MNVLFTYIYLLSNKDWQFIWDAVPGASFYRIVLFGNLIDQVTDTTYEAAIPGWSSYPPPIEVVRDSDLALSELYPPFLHMQWYAVFGCDHYEMDQSLDGGVTWRLYRKPSEVGTLPVYTIQTGRLNDGDVGLFRLTAIDSIAQMSPYREFEQFICTPPFFPDSDYVVGYTKGVGITIGPGNV